MTKLFFLILSTLLLVGCSNGNRPVKLEISAAFTLGPGGYTGGLIVSGRNPTAKLNFVRSSFGGSSLEVSLPNGGWEISVVGWDGSAPSSEIAPFQGTPSCGKASVNLGTSDENVVIKVSEANCLTSDFSGSTFITSPPSMPGIHPLKIITCGSFYEHSVAYPNGKKIDLSNSSTIDSVYCADSLHPKDMRSNTKSIKLVPVNRPFNGPMNPLINSQPFCVNDPSGVFIINEQIPVSNLPLMVIHYNDSDCTNEETRIYFPNGLKNPSPNPGIRIDNLVTLNDTIFDHHSTEVSNRLFLVDNKIKKGWSPFYTLLPEVKCSSGYCGQLASGSLYDYFSEIKYTNGAAPSNVTFEFPTDDQNACQGFSFTGFDTASDCSVVTQNNKKFALITLVPATNCSTMRDDACRSPETDYDFLFNGETKKVYLAGQRDYSGAASPINGVIPFSLIYNQFPSQSSSFTLPAGLIWSNVTGTSSNLDYQLSSSTSADLKTSYNSFYKTYYTDETGASTASLTYVETSPGSLSVNKNYVMLPPSSWEQKDIVTKIIESLGSEDFKWTFAWEKNNDEDDPEKNFGKIGSIRGLFAPDGPGAVFNNFNSCAAASGTKTVQLMEDGIFKTITIIVENIPSSPSTPTPLLKRHPSMCIGGNPNATQAACDSSTNSGYFQKKITMKENNLVSEVALFDCFQKAGRLESVGAGYDMDKSKYYRHKNILVWNTNTSTHARFESYNWNSEATSSTFGATKTSEDLSLIKIQKAGNDKQVEGRSLSYRYENEDYGIRKNVRHLRFRFEYDDTNNPEKWKQSFSYMNFFGNGSVDFFPSGSSSPYFTQQTSLLGDTHFCTSDYSFPLSFESDCSGHGYLIPLTTGVLSVNQLDYKFIKPSDFKQLMKSGTLIDKTWD